MKRLILIFFASVGVPAYAVDCDFIPAAVKAGAFNVAPIMKENSLIACADAALSNCYNLGNADDELAKSRYATVLAAFTSGKRIVLRYPFVSSCAHAVSQFPSPSELILLN